MHKLIIIVSLLLAGCSNYYDQQVYFATKLEMIKARKYQRECRQEGGFPSTKVNGKIIIITCKGAKYESSTLQQP